ncbi:hypothetical protein [Paenibacillus harenae]|uniref:Uncharacterized protein n=1 Tax=Paenibacillus harenae TaxID=306543 RepID=A0ABT9TWM9_PAEHA|nr:hypothetical protein [Paenibacillus harenae]MDQ0111738.1 hypothetical protein [Paenibacillus harenae]
MKRNALKWTILGGAIVFIVLYGIEMSSAGLERINGTFEETESGSLYEENAVAEENSQQNDENSVYARKIEELERELEETKRLLTKAGVGESEAGKSPVIDENERLPGIPVQEDAPAVDKLAESASGMLQSVSSGGIRFVVSIFDGLTK